MTHVLPEPGTHPVKSHYDTQNDIKFKIYKFLLLEFLIQYLDFKWPQLTASMQNKMVDEGELL